MDNTEGLQPSTRAMGWRPEFGLGHEVMDLQHRQLVARASELYDAITANGPRQQVAERTLALIEEARLHFDWEERLMLAHRYDGYAAHKAHHDHLLELLRDVEKQLSTGLLGHSQVLALFIETWTVQHLLVADRVLATFLLERQVTA